MRDIERRLRAAGHSDESISGRVYGCESFAHRVKYAINRFNLVGTYSVGDFLKGNFGNMKFDVIVGNPPYQGKAELHQKFFNKSVELLIDGGTVAFIQPATPYFNKKENIRAGAAVMIENVKKYQSGVKIVNGSIFENANFNTDLAITKLTKKLNDSGKLRSYENQSGVIFADIDVTSLNMIEMLPTVYQSLTKKAFSMIKRNGSLQDRITEDKKTIKLHIARIRGNVGKNDFFTFISGDSAQWKVGANVEYGIKINHKSEVGPLIAYMKSHIARFFLSIYKFNANNHMGEFRSVPQVPFDREWNDSLLCEYFKITKEEYEEIRRCIPDYYAD